MNPSSSRSVLYSAMSIPSYFVGSNVQNSVQEAIHWSIDDICSKFDRAIMRDYLRSSLIELCADIFALSQQTVLDKMFCAMMLESSQVKKTRLAIGFIQLMRHIKNEAINWGIGTVKKVLPLNEATEKALSWLIKDKYVDKDFLNFLREQSIVSILNKLLQGTEVVKQREIVEVFIDIMELEVDPLGRNYLLSRLFDVLCYLKENSDHSSIEGKKNSSPMDKKTRQSYEWLLNNNYMDEDIFNFLRDKMTVSREQISWKTREEKALFSPFGRSIFEDLYTSD